MTKINLLSPKTEIFRIGFYARFVTPLLSIGHRQTYAVVTVRCSQNDNSWFEVDKTKYVIRYQEN